MDDLYTEPQIAAVLKELKISIEGQTENDFIALCPLHGNRNTPALSVSKTSGKFICFSAACGSSGSLIELVTRITGKHHFQAIRFINKHKNAEDFDLAEHIQRVMAKPEGLVEFDSELIKKAKDRFWKSEKAQTYMRRRGFTDETLDLFDIGYSKHPRTGLWYITVPMHDKDEMPVGWIGRNIDQKLFKNTLRLPTSQTLFNLHRAKYYDDLIVVESSFDVMLLTQYGYPNAAASLGGHFSVFKADQCKRFDQIWNMTDNDPWVRERVCRQCKTSKGNICEGHSRGMVLGLKIERELLARNKSVYWPIWDEQHRFPAQDVGKMTKEHVDGCIENRISSYKFAGGQKYDEYGRMEMLLREQQTKQQETKN